jgi:CHRD domain
MSRLRLKLAIGVAVVGVAATTAAAIAGDRAKLRTSLSGYEEVPAVSTTGGGEFRAAIDRHSDRIQYQITYRAIEGTVTQSHIHFGQEGVNGGISVFLCSNLGNGPAGTQGCPQSGTVSGTITPEDVVGPAGQGIAAGEFDELVRALRAGVTYANVHSTTWPGGEIRGQIENRQDDH